MICVMVGGITMTITIYYADRLCSKCVIVCPADGWAHISLTEVGDG